VRFNKPGNHGITSYQDSRVLGISRRRFLRLSISLGAIGLVASYPLFIERYLVFANTYKITVPNLPKAFSGFRIVQLTDIHCGFFMPLAIVRRLVSKVEKIKCDLIACTGDFIHEKDSLEQIDAVWQVLSRLEAPSGVFSVLGNHDHWADTERSRYWLDRSGQNLRHGVTSITRGGERLWLAGAGDLWEDHISLDDLLKNVPASECRIVLAHNPDTADTRFSSAVDLMISGHTHGGQVDIPFWGTPVLPVRNKAYSSGLKLSPKGNKVFISRGIGTAIFPVRFNCLPEVAVLELRPQVSDT
jgi:predicted MPP superfamily phosphohydrolase